jgi:hypothetical protein
LMIKSTAQVAGILISMKRLKTGTQAQWRCHRQTDLRASLLGFSENGEIRPAEIFIPEEFDIWQIIIAWITFRIIESNLTLDRSKNGSVVLLSISLTPSKVSKKCGFVIYKFVLIENIRYQCNPAGSPEKARNTACNQWKGVYQT